ncbi:hypothetical protein HKBW3S43_00348 [Candidatus Hakubella thermalkaliphila]|uniref:Uncharacterized protein n=1 Tax=Candidatus Hakubella thermalkaliphila TaxID=2754717 RepID=A0A6V8P2S1_9ACTN|nr:hypothetical protein HKBW3S33_00062 [Candidatus Hakubella thermalkaliphila]GFP34555.1 hypothetical protein HKBW3S43_00348 [Candidatus Hakubella thermalkaliphila]GFP41389.1 hypothetical protein HKBW3C_00515 [Candidatus Hakubella thermalkaliphila]
MFFVVPTNNRSFTPEQLIGVVGMFIVAIQTHLQHVARCELGADFESKLAV